MIVDAFERETVTFCEARGYHILASTKLYRLLNSVLCRQTQRAKGYGHITAVMHQLLGRVVLPRTKNAFSSKSSNALSSSFSTPSFGSSVVEDGTSGERRLRA